MADARDELLRMLAQGAPTPDGPNRQLILPTDDEVRAVDPSRVADFSRRRGALFAEFLSLRDRISHLNHLEFCRYRLLNGLFGDGTITVSACWQEIHAVRGAETINDYNAAVSGLVASGCVQVRT